MTDRELLERAAKAAGVFMTRESMAKAWPEFEWSDEDEPIHLKGGGIRGTVLVYGVKGELSGSTRETWNPLEDDGDALRLAVKLHIQVISLPNGMSQAIWSTDTPSGFVVRNETHCDCPFAATRRAIVRAAATM